MRNIKNQTEAAIEGKFQPYLLQLSVQNLPAYITGIRDSYAGKLEEIITDCPDLYDQLKEYLENSQKEDAEKLKLYTDDLLSLGKLYSLENALSKALDKRVWLKSGGYLVIDQQKPW